MVNYQNNMCCPRRQTTPSASASPAVRTRRVESCPDTHSDILDGMPLAMAYVPWQQWREIYEPCMGFQHGTIFKELDKPFLWKGGRCR